MPDQPTSDAVVVQLQRELKDLSDRGAGIAELLDEVQRLYARRFGRRRRLTKAQFDELSRYCWQLQQAKPNGMLWGRAREMWGEGATLRRTRLGSGSTRRTSGAG
jgi:hypothetical protein